MFRSLYFNKVAQISLRSRCFPVKFAKYLGTPFYRPPPGDCFLSSYSPEMFSKTAALKITGNTREDTRVGFCLKAATKIEFYYWYHIFRPTIL